jgi:glutathione S-transferase
MIPMNLTLIIGNKNYSSWSLRPWLYLKHHGIAFDEIRIPLYLEDSKAKILAHSPSGKVPALRDGDTVVWDSLAILEYLAERFPETRGWPEDMAARAKARALSAEMHAGFQALRSECGMNCRRPLAAKALSEAAHKDIARINQIWQECRQQHSQEGPWLFGHFGIVDAMYAPVALRFHIYQLDRGPAAQAYVDNVLAHPAVAEWMAAGRQESERIPAFDD